MTERNPRKMTEPFSTTTNIPMMLLSKLEIIHCISDGHNIAQDTQKLKIDCESPKRILKQRERLKTY